MRDFLVVVVDGGWGGDGGGLDSRLLVLDWCVGVGGGLVGLVVEVGVAWKGTGCVCRARCLGGDNWVDVVRLVGHVDELLSLLVGLKDVASR